MINPPQNALEWYNKGIEYCQKQMPNEALLCFDKAVSIDPNYIDALIDKGTMLDVLNRFREAIEVYDWCLLIDPKNIKVWYNKAISYDRHLNFQEALSCYDKVISLDKEHDSIFKRYAKKRKNELEPILKKLGYRY